MSAAIFAFSPFHLADAVSLADWTFWFTFWTACSAAACACATRATTLSCASFCAAAAASSAFLARTDKLASCSESDFIVRLHVSAPSKLIIAVRLAGQIDLNQSSLDGP